MFAAGHPEFFNVDVSGLDIGDSVHIEDLAMPEGVTAIYESNLALSVGGAADR